MLICSQGASGPVQDGKFRSRPFLYVFTMCYRERLGLCEMTGLEGALFSMLDAESDRKLCSDVQDTLVSVLQALAADHLTRWLALIKDVLQATTGK